MAKQTKNINAGYIVCVIKANKESYVTDTNKMTKDLGKAKIFTTLKEANASHSKVAKTTEGPAEIQTIQIIY